MVNREIWLKQIKQAWAERSIIWLSGVRRVGKTYLCQGLASVEYFDCELPNEILFKANDVYISSNGRSSLKWYKRVLGCHYWKNTVIGTKHILYFNIEKFKTIRRLNLTIIHEVMHLKGRKKHTSKFYKDIVKEANNLFDGIEFEKYSYKDNWEGFK